MELVSEQKSFGGWHKQYSHTATTTACDMRFAVFLPSNYGQGKKLPVVYWLSGLTCTDENFMQKAGAHRIAEELGIVIVAPDTSPRGDGVANDDAYDLGQGAGFYVNATQAPWQPHFQMYDYIVKELPALIKAEFEVSDDWAIAGHSMGGHGALTIALKNAGMFTSVSAFSPIVNPCECPWGQKAFAAYLGDDKNAWQAHDATCLIKNGAEKLPMLISQGLDDQFLTEQLKTENLAKVAEENAFPVTVEMHEGYDHSYYFIASFIEQHLRFHAQYLKA